MLLDTNIIIYYFKGLGSVGKSLLATPPSDIAVASVTVYELLTGIEKSGNASKKKHALNTMLDTLHILAFGKKEAVAAASIRCSLEKSGTPIGPYDIQIAATALANNHTLVTHNTREFSRIAGLSVVDWY